MVLKLCYASKSVTNGRMGERPGSNICPYNFFEVEEIKYVNAKWKAGANSRPDLFQAK